MWSRAAVYRVADWSKRVVFSVRAVSQGNTTNGVNRILLGPNVGDSIQDLDDNGIGFIIDNLAIKGQTHDGTSLEEVDLSTSLTSGTTATLTAISDGAGNVEYFVNGVSKGTGTGGPSDSSTTGHDSIAVMSENNADSASQRVTVCHIKVGWAQ
jgi:hypothetical protein